MQVALRTFDQADAPARLDAQGDAHTRHRRPLSAVTVILALNIVVFVTWQLASRGSSLETFMVENFLISTKTLLSGRVWTLLTAAFSHAGLIHFAVNMMVSLSFGRPLEHLLGTRMFVGFYLTAAVISSLSHCFLSLVIGRGWVPALGASGALSGLLLVFALIFPRHRILLFGVIPIPALIGALAFVAIDVWGLVAQSQGGGFRIGHGAHLGGSACGALFYFTVLRDRVRAARARAALPISREEAAEIERLHAMIQRDGPGALNPKEQDFLLRIRERVEQAGGGTS